MGGKTEGRGGARTTKRDRVLDESLDGALPYGITKTLKSIKLPTTHINPSDNSEEKISDEN